MNKKSLKTEAIIQQNFTHLLMPVQLLYQNSLHLKWKDKNKEVKMNGKMYDVIGIIHHAKQVTILLVEDFKETNWLLCYDNLNKQNNNWLYQLLLLFNQMHFYDRIDSFIHLSLNCFPITHAEETQQQTISGYLLAFIKPPLPSISFMSIIN